MKHLEFSLEDEIIDIEWCTSNDKKPPKGRKYRIIVDNQKYVVDKEFLTGSEILILAGKTPVECHSLYQKLKHSDFEKIDLSENVDLTKTGIEKFVVKPPEVFHYTVDGEPETTDLKVLTPTQILELAGIIPASDYYLVQKNPDGTEISYKGKPNEIITMRCPAMSFISIFNGETPVS
jgi:hypothetical protein